MPKPTVEDFMYSQSPFPSCCGALVIHATGLKHNSTSGEIIDWDVLPDAFITGLTKKFDNITGTGGWSPALVAVTLPACPGRMKYHDYFDKVEEIFLATGWTPGIKSNAPHGPYLNQFWTRPAKGIYIKE